MKLFNKKDHSPELKLSTEQFVAYYQTAQVISTENISDYLYKIKDKFHSITSQFKGEYDQLGIDVTKTQFELEHVIKRIKFNDVRHHLVMKPENFKGKYVAYLKDTASCAEELVKNTFSTLNTLKLTIASFINEYREDEVFTLYGVEYFDMARQVTEDTTNKLSKYFGSNNSVKAHIGDLLQTFNDVPTIHEEIHSIAKVLTIDSVKQINKIAEEAASLVDSLIEQNAKSGALTRNEEAKKELVAALHISAKQVETVSYMYAQIMHFYAAYKELSTFLINFGNQPQ